MTTEIKNGVTAGTMEYSDLETAKQYIEDEEYAAARIYLQNAIKVGNPLAYYYMAKLEDRSDYESEAFSLSGKDIPAEQGGIFNRDPDIISLSNSERAAYNLLLGASAGDNKAQVELAHTLLNRYTGWTLWTWLDKIGVLKNINYALDFGIDKFEIELIDIEMPSRGGYARGKKLTAENSNKLEGFLLELLERYATADNAAAQYYLGMYYAKKYELSCKDSDKNNALKWLNASYDEVCDQAYNIDKTLKCLKKFLCVNWPPMDDFVAA